MQITQNLKQKIEEKILQLNSDFLRVKGLLLTEADLKCNLFKKLTEIEEFNKEQKTEDTQILSTPIHSELSWYNENGKLYIKPDLTIINPRNLTILHEYRNWKGNLPSKGCEFGGNSFIFELKFIRTKRLTLSKFKKEILKDFTKIKELFQKLDNEHNPLQIFCFFIIFTKTNEICSEFSIFLEENRDSLRHKILFYSGEIQFE